MPFRIKKADAKDAAGIARVHIDTWRTSYRGIVPDNHLSNLSYNTSRRQWERALLDRKSQPAVYIAEDDAGDVVGFVSCGPDRDNDPTYVGEIFALYVLQKMQRMGIGGQLMTAAVRDLKSRGLNSMIVWVLAANPSRRFYERLGGDHVQTRNITIGGKQLEEYGYGWKNLDLMAVASEGKNLGRPEALTVREIMLEDCDAIRLIAQSLHPTWFTESALEEITHAVRYETGYVALENGVPVGFVTYKLSEDGVTAELTWIGVRSDFHRKGVGRSLVEAVEQEISGKGFKALEVSTVAATVNYEPYDLTRKFYHAIGFADVTVEPKGFPSGDDKLLLRKRLRKNE